MPLLGGGVDVDLWGWLTGLAVKDIVIAFIGSAAGAIGGAWAAQRISDRGKLREMLRKEVVRTNAVIDLLLMHIRSSLNLGILNLTDPTLKV
jgi:hypothetical protein